ncbi:tetratricopeptide repeat protein [Spirulina subsalsa FACHB-351]|uniref:Tetratricopeptide repeat protein n=1 Tax=Spirulina subsalsa FACHB-351 TaxID=234711 RepID=A0ABT3LAC8_9CYAN|nr:tetratricopeptide repeat protein [Spirulina subsalsa]MCW6038467.1 tetratricopeptide repeat protein [Spirulina subsalsa FACHB-351]
MGHSITVNTENFAQEVVETSHQKPVLVDFFATWCGPCQVLKPLLEKLVQEYDFILAKVDIDQNPELASQFGVEGVPDVRVVQQGRVFSGFVGATSEGKIRELLAQLNLKSSLELGLEAAKQAIAQGNAPLAKQQYDQLFEQFPDSALVTIEAAKFLLQVNQPEAAQKMLNTIDSSDRDYAQQIQSLRLLIELTTAAKQGGESELDRKFAQAAQNALSGDYEEALQGFLEIVECDRQYRKDGAKKALLSLFSLLGHQHPLTQKYQQELTLLLF